MPTANTPASIGYSAIWAALNAYPAFANPQTIKPGLQTEINFQIPNMRPPTNSGASDTPSLQLLEGRILGKPYQRNSKAVQIEVGYPVSIRSGFFNIDIINLLQATFMQALMSADTLNNVLYPGTLAGVTGNAVDINKWELAPGNFTQRDFQRGVSNPKPAWMVAFNVNLTFVWYRARYVGTSFIAS